MSRLGYTAVAVAAAVFAVALAVRIGTGAVPPFDDLYHLKRIEWSSRHFPGVLEYDPERGIGGAFCPWPPLYDFSSGVVNRMFGGVGWLPPIFFASFTALIALGMSGFGSATRDLRPATRDLRPEIAAAVAGFTIALSPYLIGVSARGHIDHHYVEPLLLLLIVFATATRRGILLGLAIAAALLVQTALLVAAAIAFVAMWMESSPPGRQRRREPHPEIAESPAEHPDSRRTWISGDGGLGGSLSTSGAAGFALAAVIVVAWRMTRAPGYPDSAWFLGYPHAAALAGAAIALALTRVTSRGVALAGGAVAALAVPSFAPAFLGGVGFFRGDAWLRTILEFQPMFNHPSQFGTDVANLTGGAIVSLFLFKRYRTFSIFAAAYLVLAVSSRRFLVPAIPLFAIGGGLVVLHAQKRWIAIAAAALTLGPPVAYDVYAGIAPAEHAELTQFASSLRNLPRGRVLAPWWHGHAIDVIGGQPVVLDNFGSMPDQLLFENANDIFRATRTDVFLAWCRAHHVRYVVLTEPRSGLRSSAAVVGLSPAFYDGTRLASRTAWWRLYHGREHDPSFRRLQGGVVQVWEVGPR